jgi:outer membrane protein OmpA-like peptidoglycan-associated protein
MSQKYLTVAALTLALGACATAPPPNAALETARAQVAAAEADPNVAQYDALDLQAARQDLAAAEAANTHRDEPQTGQMAYIAAQTARLAQARAAAKAYEARIAQGTTERDRIQGQARAREANVALQQRNEAVEQRNEATMQAAQSAQQASQLQAEIEQLKAKQTDRGLVLTLGDVLFDTGRASLNPGAALKLDRLAAFLNEHPDRRVQIEGFTDGVGGDAYNQDLSERRAEAVKAALTMRGIDSSRISTEGYGKAFPVASNSDSGGRQLNRRVEVVIGNANTPITPRS